MNGVWACRACIERGGAVPASGPEYADLGWCGAGGHKVTGLWWFPDGLATLTPPPTVVSAIQDVPERMPPEVRRERAQARERASAGGRQLSFLDQL
jgi:hypothetical protein